MCLMWKAVGGIIAALIFVVVVIVVICSYIGSRKAIEATTQPTWLDVQNEFKTHEKKTEDQITVLTKKTDDLVTTTNNLATATNGVKDAVVKSSDTIADRMADRLKQFLAPTTQAVAD